MKHTVRNLIRLSNFIFESEAKWVPFPHSRPYRHIKFSVSKAIWTGRMWDW